MHRKFAGDHLHAATWSAACVVVLACVAVLQLGMSFNSKSVLLERSRSQRIVQKQLSFSSGLGAKQLPIRSAWSVAAGGKFHEVGGSLRKVQLVQQQSSIDAASAAAALRRDIQKRGGAQSGAMGVVRHVMRDLATTPQAKDNGCDCSQQQLPLIGQSLSSCGCPQPMPPPRLVNGEDCEDFGDNYVGRTRGVRWLVDCPSKWVPARRVTPPTVQPEEGENYEVGPNRVAKYIEALPVAPGEEEPGIQADVMGPRPDIFSPQEPWHELQNYRNEWYFDYEAAPYTSVYDDSSEHDQFAPEEPWNDRPSEIVLDATLADVKRACLGAGEDHAWNSESHECLYHGHANYAELPRGISVTQEGPNRKAMDGEVPIGDVIDDTKELDEFGARRPEPAGEVDQFGWRPPSPVRLRDTTLDYQTIDLEKGCRAQMNIPEKGKYYSWDPQQGKCLFLGLAARAEEEPGGIQSAHPLTDGIYADMKRDCVQRGGAWEYPRVDGQAGTCEV